MHRRFRWIRLLSVVHTNRRTKCSFPSVPIVASYAGTTTSPVIHARSGIYCAHSRRPLLFASIRYIATLLGCSLWLSTEWAVRSLRRTIQSSAQRCMYHVISENERVEVDQRNPPPLLCFFLLSYIHTHSHLTELSTCSIAQNPCYEVAEMMLSSSEGGTATTPRPASPTCLGEEDDERVRDEGDEQRSLGTDDHDMEYV